MICPGIVATPIYDEIPEEERRRIYRGVAESLPVKRVGTPRDVAASVLEVMSNGYVTGTVVHVDGGGLVA